MTTATIDHRRTDTRTAAEPSDRGRLAEPPPRSPPYRRLLPLAILAALALAGWSAALWTIFPDPYALLGLFPAAAHLFWQVLKIDPADGLSALRLFRSNRFTGLLLFLAFFTVGLSARP